MVEFKARQHRLEIPPAPTSDDPAVQRKYSNDLRRLVMDEFNRLASDYYDFKQATYNAGVIPLRGVSNIAVTRDQYSMSVVWENPQQDEITPTHVRVRIKEITPDAWAEYTYPITTWEFNGLQPDTQYLFEVQLVARFEATDTFVSTTRNCPSVAVLRTAESEIKAKSFTTDVGVGPPRDGGTNNTVITWTFPDTVGTPGVPSSANCWWNYKFQRRVSCDWIDSSLIDINADGNVGSITVDSGIAPFSTFPNSVWRIAYREVCNAVPQAWVYTQPFMAMNYANANCGGIVKSASLTTAPYNTADIFLIPGVCQSSGGNLRIINEVGDVQLHPQFPGFSCVEYVDSEWTLIGADTSNTAISNTIFRPMLQGLVSGIPVLKNDSDFTFGFDIRIPNNALALAGGTGAYDIINIGQKIKAQIIQNTATYSVQVVVPRDGGGAYVFRANGLAYGAWNAVFYQHDVSEPDGRKLLVNFVLADQSANAIANDFDGISQALQINTVNSMRLRRIGLWNGLTAVQVFAPDTIADCIHWWDFSQFTVGGTTIPDLVGTADLTQTASPGVFGGHVVGDDGRNYMQFSGITGLSNVVNARVNAASAADLALVNATDNTLTFFLIFWPDDPVGDAGTTNRQRVHFERGSGPTGDYRQHYISQTNIAGGGEFTIWTYNGAGGVRGGWSKWGVPAPRNQVWHGYFTEFMNKGGNGIASVDNDAWTSANVLMVPDSEAIFNTAGLTTNTTDPLRFGGGGLNEFWYGSIAHAVVWNGVLTPAERDAVLLYFEVQGWF